jgi:hypothetical protein
MLVMDSVRRLCRVGLSFDILSESDEGPPIDATQSGVAFVEARRCNVSGRKAIRHNPSASTARPQHSGIHGEMAMRVDATVGAISSAVSVAQAPKRNAFALEYVRTSFRGRELQLTSGFEL